MNFRGGSQSSSASPSGTSVSAQDAAPVSNINNTIPPGQQQQHQRQQQQQKQQQKQHQKQQQQQKQQQRPWAKNPISEADARRNEQGVHGDRSSRSTFSMRILQLIWSSRPILYAEIPWSVPQLCRPSRCLNAVVWIAFKILGHLNVKGGWKKSLQWVQQHL